MMNRKHAIALVLYIINIFFVFAQSDFEKGIEAHQQHNYEQAIILYEQAIAKHQIAPELYSNLGNAYFQTNQIGKAILNLERAYKLKPDLIHAQNLQTVKSKLIDELPTIRPFFLTSWTQKLVQITSINALIIISLLLIGSVALGLYWFYFLRDLRFKKLKKIWKLTIPLAIVSCILVSTAYQQTKTIEAIILEKKTNLFQAASNQSPALELIHEGLKVRIIDKMETWTKIRLQNGTEGWVQNTSYEVI